MTKEELEGKKRAVSAALRLLCRESLMHGSSSDVRYAGGCTVLRCACCALMCMWACRYSPAGSQCLAQAAGAGGGGRQGQAAGQQWGGATLRHALVLRPLLALSHATPPPEYMHTLTQPHT